ncbi:AAA family ATPase [Streptomyces sp. NPDC091416]|uniref:AAA family ATPase n=1 Tax=Streptomyces sp. NPDC091416 TaxID=3366003 RepID=UPI003818D8C5
MPDSPTWTNASHKTGPLLPEVSEGGHGTRRVVLFGPPGSGKTTATGVLGRQSGLPVLRLAPGPQDAEVASAGLLELALALPASAAARELTAALDETAGRSGSPDDAGRELRLRRLTAALLREAPPMTLVVDNAQWLDHASAAVLGWALRLTPDLPVIAAERVWRPGAAGHWCGEDTRAVHIPPLTAPQVAALLSPYRLASREVSRIHAHSGGNPALALALADAPRPLADREGESEPALPPAARRLVGKWLGEVPAQVRELLTFAALDDRPDLELLGRLVGPGAEALLAQAEAAGLCDIGRADGSVRFTASAIGTELATRLPGDARRLLHARLVEASHDSVRRDRHTVLAADDADPLSAHRAARAAVRARQRGDHALAAELSFLAAWRTSHDHEELLTERALTAVRDAAHYGDLPHGRAAARLVLGHDTTTEQRVDALIALIDASGQHLHGADELFADALHTAAGRPDLTAQILIRQSVWANVSEGDPHRACALAGRATALAETAEDTTTAMALTMQARLQRLLGHSDAETTLGRALSLPRAASIPANGTPQHLAARHALFDDHPDKARTALLPLLVEAERAGDAEATVDILRSLAEAELRAGRCARALDHADRPTGPPCRPHRPATPPPSPRAPPGVPTSPSATHAAESTPPGRRTTRSSSPATSSPSATSSWQPATPKKP